jgi:prepilin-type N-terminal cleavage/methylation domain-containing protein
MRYGMTLIELSVVLAIVVLLTAVALPAAAALRDRALVRSATTDVLASLAAARQAAIANGRLVAVRFDTSAARLVVTARAETLGVYSLRRAYGVSLAVTRDSIAYAPTGLGYGASNTRLTLRRRDAVDTIVISRLGRARH